MSLNLLYHLQFTAVEAFRICVFVWTDLAYLPCIVLFTDMTKWLPAVNVTSATSAPPSPIISQGQWHAPVEPSPQLPWQLFSHWAGYLSLSQWWCDKCHNYVNSVQPKCFCRLNIASWKALGPMLSALEFFLVNNPSFIVASLHASDSVLCSSFRSFTHQFLGKVETDKLSI